MTERLRKDQLEEKAAQLEGALASAQAFYATQLQEASNRLLEMEATEESKVRHLERHVASLTVQLAEAQDSVESCNVEINKVNETLTTKRNDLTRTRTESRRLEEEAKASEAFLKTECEQLRATLGEVEGALADLRGKLSDRHGSVVARLVAINDQLRDRVAELEAQSESG